MPDLHRFVDAQRGVHERVTAELEAGEKRGHWMWFVFPQIAGLGRSAMAQRYAIESLDEARAYLAHPVLGPRLRGWAALVRDTEGRTAEQIFGGVDAMKLQSSMTLFHAAAPDEAVFADVLTGFFGGEEDPLTRRLV